MLRRENPMHLARSAGNLINTDKTLIELVPEVGVEPTRF
jgi:hypothetical protein